MELDEPVRLFDRGLRFLELVVRIYEIELALGGVVPEGKPGAQLSVVVDRDLEVPVVE